jgi:phenylacetate-CoA ligase
MGAWSAEPSKGPEGFPVIDKLEGRMQEFVVCHDHRLVSVATLGAAHFSELSEVNAIQYEQDTPGLLVLKVESENPPPPQVLQRVAQSIESVTQGGCRAQVQVVSHIPRTSRGKRSLLVQHLDLSGFLGSALPTEFDQL